ncbi:MAG: hypothetical protein LUG21_08490 [Clostridiales bacterium]|nr:hypothetical protein [Clostridiales bacterium]
MKIKKDILIFIILISACAVLISFSYNAKQGGLYGIALCEKVIIPSLLPLLMIFNLIQNSGAGRILEKLLAPITVGLFRLPKSAGAAVFFGLTGGYPAGALLTHNLYKNNDIDSKEAARIMRFNFNGGAAFIITAVGAGFLQSQKAGLILFASTTSASLLTAFLSSFFNKKEQSTQTDYFSVSFDEALSKSVYQAIKSIAGICAYIILFSAFNSIISTPAEIAPLIEITGALSEKSSYFTLEQTAFFLEFGGLCIHMQIFGLIKDMKMKYFDFFIWRVINSFAASGICFILLKLFPLETPVFSNYSQSIVRFTSVNATLSSLMIFGCAVFIFDLENKKLHKGKL